MHRHEFSGALNGLLRVRTFCQDDAHIFVTPEQIENEIKAVIKQVDEVYSTLGFAYEVELSTRPDDSMGSNELWTSAEGALSNVLEDLAIDYRVNAGDGAFYGPKIDFHIRDALNRSHQCATVQLDFQMPEKFDLNYIDQNNEKQRPVVIHRAICGSMDRFIGILTEHFAGVFPVWLAPVQVKIIPVSTDVHEPYAVSCSRNKLKQAGVRVEIDARNEKLGYKIREAQMKKIPYVLVVGDQESESGSVTIRKYGEEKTETVPLDAFMKSLAFEIEKKQL